MNRLSTAALSRPLPYSLAHSLALSAGTMAAYVPSGIAEPYEDLYRDSDVCLLTLLNHSMSLMPVFQVLIIQKEDWFRKLRHALTFAKKYRHVEGCSYGLCSRIFGDYSLALLYTKSPNVEHNIWPQGPLFDRTDRSNLTDEEKKSAEKVSRRTPDFYSLGVSIDRKRDVGRADLAFWVEVKACPTGASTTEELLDLIHNRFEDTIDQVNGQAAYAFHTIPHGARFYAFLVILTRFCLLSYERPRLAGASAAKLGPDGEPVKPETPVVLYWNQPIVNSHCNDFTLVFLEALEKASVNFPDMALQPSWFQKQGVHSEAQLVKINIAKACPCPFVCSRLTIC